MATLATYVFPDRNSADAAFSKIRNDIGYGIHCSGDIVEITDECKDSQKAGEICRAYGGKPK